MNNKEKFIELLSSVDRKGMDKLIEWLKSSSFFEDPASVNHHLSIEGGLCQHSLNVYHNLKNLIGEGCEEFKDSIIIIGLLHDLCKTGTYEKSFRNVKNDSGKWEQVPCYKYKPGKLPYGHGEKSVLMASSFIKLTNEEMLAIRWHMGAYEPKELYPQLGEAFGVHPLIILTHAADLMATYYTEKEEK